MSSYVFLTECADIGEAQVVKSFLESQGFHPKVRDEQMRTVAPHLQNLLGRLIIEVPEFEALEASLALEKHEGFRPQVVGPEEEQARDAAEAALHWTQGLAKKCVTNAILGCLFIPVLCNLYSMILGYRVLVHEKPLTSVSRKRLMLATLFNTIAFYLWLTFGLRYVLKNF